MIEPNYKVKYIFAGGHGRPILCYTVNDVGQYFSSNENKKSLPKPPNQVSSTPSPHSMYYITSSPLFGDQVIYVANNYSQSVKDNIASMGKYFLK